MPRLLVIDDEPSLRHSLQTSLQSPALEVVTAATARQGIEAARQSPPDAVILDVRLPDMPGLEAFDEIRRIDPRLPVIVITAFTTTETAIEAMRRGAFEYMLKPVDFHRLRERVEKAIELSRLRHAPAVLAGERHADDVNVDRVLGQTSAFPSDATAGAHDVADFVRKLLKAGDSDIYQKVTAVVDRLVIETVLRHVKGSQAQASAVLGISRTTLRVKLRFLGLVIEKQLLPHSFPG